MTSFPNSDWPQDGQTALSENGISPGVASEGAETFSHNSTSSPLVKGIGICTILLFKSVTNETHPSVWKLEVTVYPASRFPAFCNLNGILVVSPGISVSASKGAVEER